MQELEQYQLEYLQVMTFMYKLKEMRKDNPYFRNEIADGFEKNMVKRTAEIALTSPMTLKVVPNANKYPVSRSMVEYLSRLTGIDVFDEECVQSYIPLIEKTNKEAQARILIDQLMRVAEEKPSSEKMVSSKQKIYK